MYNDFLMENNALYNEIESEYSSDLSYIDYKDFNDTEQDILDDEPEQDIPDEDELFDQLEIYPITKRKRYELSELFDKYIDNLNELTNKVNEAKSKILSKNGYIITDEKMKTSIEGIFAAGDVRASNPAQAAVAVGDGARAALAIREYLQSF
jgi:hypothetical protein